MTMMFFLLCLAVCFDVRTFRIPNGLILIGYAGGFLYQIFCTDSFEIMLYPLAAIGMFLLLIPFFQMHAIGGGDVKLLSVCAMFTGLESAVSIALYSLFSGGIISIFYLVYYRFFSKQKKQKRHVIHFSIPILIGAVAEHIWGGILWQQF